MSDARGASNLTSRPRRLAARTTEMRPSKRCSAVSASGKPCKAPPLRGKKRCAFHSGNNASICGQRGGRRRAIFNPANLEPLPISTTAAEMKTLVATTISEVRAARLDTKTAHAIFYGATTFFDALEKADYDARLRVLEERQAAQQKAPRTRPSG